MSPAQVFVIGAVTEAQSLSGAFLRAGRFDRIVEVPVPSPAQRTLLLSFFLRAVPLAGPLDRPAFLSQLGKVCTARDALIADDICFSPPSYSILCLPAADGGGICGERPRAAMPRSADYARVSFVGCRFNFIRVCIPHYSFWYSYNLRITSSSSQARIISASLCKRTT
jgi:hypothetical protein